MVELVAAAKGRRLRVSCEAPGCGLPFEPFPRQQLPLCPYHRRLHEAEREREKKSQVAGPRPGPGPRLQRRGGGQALALITEPMKRRDGWRHLWLGDTGTGKTYAQHRLVDLPGQLTFIHDDSKADREYDRDGVRYFRTAAELEALPVDEANFTAAAFRGDPYAGVVCEVEEVADLTLRCARRRWPTRLVVDEWDRAMSDGGRKLEAPSLRTCLIFGRTMGLSVAGGAQIPQRVGDVIYNSASSVGLFRCGPAACNYIEERLQWDREMTEVIPTLAVGDFLLHRPGQPWDRTVYRF